MTTRATLKMETQDGPAIYAGRVEKLWHISIPGGRAEEFVGTVFQIAERLEQIANEEFGGAGKLLRQLEMGFVPYRPGSQWDKAGYHLLQGAW